MPTDELSMLQQEVAALRREMATLRRLSSPAQRPRRRLRWLTIGLAALLLATLPLGLLAANFQDLNPGSPHNADINAIADAGISKGCIDANHYCPNDFVTREQMASFLARTAGLGNNPPVANAKTAQTATNAAQLGGIPASGYLRPVGDLVYQVSPLGLVDLNNQIGVNVTIAPSYQGIVAVSSDVVGSREVLLPLVVPKSIFGKSLTLSAVTICYSAESGSKIDGTGVFETTGDGGYLQDFYDGTDRSSAAYSCYTVNDASLYAISGDPYLSLSLKFTSTTAKLTLARISVVLTAIP